MKKTFGIRMPSDLMTEIERLAEQRGESASATAIDLLRSAIASERLEGAIAKLEQRLEHRIIALEQSQGRHATGLRKLDERMESVGLNFSKVFNQMSGDLSALRSNASDSMSILYALRNAFMQRFGL